MELLNNKYNKLHESTIIYQQTHYIKDVIVTLKHKMKGECENVGLSYVLQVLFSLR